MGTPVWSHGGIICTGESYKNVVKLTFAKGASLKDPARLFNSSLDGNVRRAIDIHEGEDVDESAFKVLVRQAIALNSSAKAKPAKPSEAETCGEYGTSVHFEKTPSDAARKALKEEKLVFVLHVSGHFEETEFT